MRHLTPPDCLAFLLPILVIARRKIVNSFRQLVKLDVAKQTCNVYVPLPVNRSRCFVSVSRLRKGKTFSE